MLPLEDSSSHRNDHTPSAIERVIETSSEFDLNQSILIPTDTRAQVVGLDLPKGQAKKLSTLVDQTVLSTSGSLVDPEGMAQHRANQRGEIAKLFDGSLPRLGQKLSALEEIDPVYLTPKEKALLVNEFMLAHKPKYLNAAAELTRSLLVDIRAESKNAVEFRESIAPENLVLLAERMYGSAAELRPVRGSFFRDDLDFDGCLIGAAGKAYQGADRIFSVPGIEPRNKGVDYSAQRLKILVNGINNDVSEHVTDMQRLANVYQAPFVGIHNGHYTLVFGLPGVKELICEAADFVHLPQVGKLIRGIEFRCDLYRTLNDAHNRFDNPAINTARDTVLSVLLQGRETEFIAVSHGANILSRGISRACEVLQAAGWTDDEIKAGLSKIKVETYAGACWEYPDGPDYKHYVLKNDAIAYSFGLTRLALTEAEKDIAEEFHSKPNQQFPGIKRFAEWVWNKNPNPLMYAGKGAEIIVLDRSEAIDREEKNPHDFSSYLPRRQKFEKRMPESLV